MPTPACRIRMMTEPDVALAIEWAAAEGWNPGLHDAECFLAADPRGFLMGVVDDEPVASISVVKYGASFGFLGLYIVKPGHRGRGYGLELWNAGIAHLGQRTIGLDGVVAQQANYRRSGFELAYRNVRHRGVARPPSAADPRIVPLASIAFADLLDYDRRCFPAERSAFLKGWIHPTQGAALACRARDRLAGYGVIRAARDGWKIGPLFADDPEHAEALFGALVAAAPAGTAIVLDTPEPNRAAVDLAERHGMTAVFETARMYTGAEPALPIERIYGVTSFELG